ncbi:MAG: PAS domain S-box protein [Sulfuricellaceae bacterium]|nr:PAS domain S-box protein [Sulfuricellaceae bacterium]
MSDDSGRKKLRYRVFWAVALGWTLLMVGLMVWNGSQSRAQIMRMAYMEARTVYNMDITFRRWGIDHGGVYVPVSPIQQPVSDLAHVFERDVVTPSGRQLTLIAPALMLRQVMDRYAKDFDAKGRITGLKQLNANNAPDVWEKKQLEAFAQGKYKDVWEIAEFKGKPHLRYLHVMMMEADCLKCHAVLGYKLGEVRGATGTNLPLEPFYAEITDMWQRVALSYGGVWFLGLIGLFAGGSKMHHYLRMRDAAESHLRQSEIRFRDLVESSPDWIWEADKAGVYTYASPRCMELYGYAPEEMVGQRRSAFLDPEHASEDEAEFARFAAEQRSFHAIEHACLNRDGRRLTVETSGQPIIDAAGCLQGYRGIDRDVTMSRETLSSLAHSELRYRTLFDDAPDLIHSVDADGLLSDVNPAELAALGYERDELIGQPLFKIIHPDDHEAVRERRKQVLAGESILRFEVLLLTKDGEPLPAEASITTQFEGGKPVARVIMRDQRDRLARERALRDQAARLSAISKSSPVFFYEIDPQGVVRYLNRCHFSLHRKDLMDSPIADRFDSADRDRLARQIAWVRRSGLSDVGEYVLQVEGGEYRHFSIDFSPIEYAGTAHVLLTLQDIEKSRQARLALGKSESWLRAILDNEPESIELVDARGIVRMINQAGLAMLEAEDAGQIIGQQADNLVAPEDLPTFSQLFERVLSGSPGDLTFAVLGLKGGRRIVEARAVPIRDEENREAMMLCLARDVTSLKQAEVERGRLEDRLEKAYRLETMGQLTGSIAHDFNNFLSSIMGYASLALERFAPDKSGRLADYLREILSASERARELTQSMMVYSRSQKAEVVEPSALQPVVAEAISAFRKTLPPAVVLEMECEPNLLAARVNPVDAQRVLANLLANAGDAVGEAGRIAVSLRAVHGEHGDCSICGLPVEGDYLVLAVRDDGVGIAPENVPKIFDPFFTTKSASGSAGMGLAIVFGLLAKAHGHVQVDSMPGQGSEFRLYFPVEKASDAITPPVNVVPVDVVQRAGQAPVQEAARMIMVVDDEKSVASMVGEALVASGYAVNIFTHSREALQHFISRPEQYCAVITDQTMPGLVGTEMAQAMLAISPHLPIILCSGYSELIDEASAKRIGIRRFFNKPVDLVALLEDVREAVKV